MLPCYSTNIPTTVLAVCALCAFSLILMHFLIIIDVNIGPILFYFSHLFS